jgi:hypothetical protein
VRGEADDNTHPVERSASLAKSAANTSKKEASASASRDTTTLEAAVVAFAEQLGHVAGTVQAKADGWLDGATLNEQLTRIRDGATDLLNQLGGAAASVPVVGRAVSAKRKAKPVTRTKAPARHAAKASTARSGGMVDAPGKTHRKPPPTIKGLKKSDQTIPKARSAQQMRQRPRG